jgi:uncharacterized repeat protein (TIGR03803 family)
MFRKMQPRRSAALRHVYRGLNSPSRRGRRAFAASPVLEQLEDRLVPSISAVTQAFRDAPSNLLIDDSGNFYGIGDPGASPILPPAAPPPVASGLFEVKNGSNQITSLPGPPSANPTRLIVDSHGNLFGLANNGTIFELAQGSGMVTTLAAFNGTNGSGPNSLVIDQSGNLYGTTDSGGANGDGAVFELPEGSANITLLASFNGANGSSPNSLIVGQGGNLYGTTSRGGAHNDGTVFEMPAGSGTITTLAAFDGANGASPGDLLIDSNGNLYGTAGSGPGNGGEVFEVAANTGTVTVLAATGANLNNLVRDRAGNLYGTTPGGASLTDGGSVFKLARGSGTISTLFAFPMYVQYIYQIYINGIFPGPYGFTPNSLVAGPDGNLYGLTSGDAYDNRLFSYSNGPYSLFELPPVTAANTVPAPAPTAQPWIDRVYRDLLNRPVDPVGQSAWTNLLNRGVSHQTVVTMIEQSVEYHSNEVGKLYQQLLHRNADAQGMNSFVNALGSGATILQVEAAMAGSPEFFQNAGGTSQGFVTALYSDLLHRAPDPGGQAILLAALRGDVSRQAVAAAVLSSDEFYSDMVSSLYGQFLHRAPDPFGFNVSMQALRNGFSEESLVAVLLGSDEYFASSSD